jgi:hypothetical protein
MSRINVFNRKQHEEFLMGTIITAIDGDYTFRAYMRDNYPYDADAYESIREALIRDFPRFETNDFDKAFAAANKIFSKTYPGGEVHLTHRQNYDDLECRQEVFVKDNETYIKAYEIDYRKALHLRGKESLVYEGSSVDDFFTCIDESACEQERKAIEMAMAIEWFEEYEKNSRSI